MQLPWEAGAGGGSSRSLSWTTDAADVGAVAAFGPGRRTTSVEAVLLACWQTLLWRLSGQAEVLVETSFDGRKYEEMHQAIGAYANLSCRSFAKIEEGFNSAICCGN